MELSLKERSKRNESLVVKIKDEKMVMFYECTIHNMYYSVYQRMKALICDKENDRVSHGDIIDLCKKHVKLNSARESEELYLLSEVKSLYRARVLYDYKQCTSHIDREQYIRYYHIMKKANEFLDKFIK